MNKNIKSKINTIILTNKFIDYSVSNKDDILIIKTKEDIEVFQERFKNYLINFSEKIKILNNLSHQAVIKLTDFNFENSTQELKDFQNKYDNCENFKKENCLFEIDNQYINITSFLYNNDINEYGIYSLEEWVEKKN